MSETPRHKTEATGVTLSGRYGWTNSYRRPPEPIIAVTKPAAPTPHRGTRLTVPYPDIQLPHVNVSDLEIFLKYHPAGQSVAPRPQEASMQK